MIQASEGQLNWEGNGRGISHALRAFGVKNYSTMQKKKKNALTYFYDWMLLCFGINGQALPFDKGANTVLT